MRRSLLALMPILCGCVLLLPSTARAQATLSGLVQDESGAVLPGVTVEASSPALIEKVRSVATDGAGRYTIVDLRPGTYAVSFTLAGFSTVRREGIVLSGSGAVQLNVNLMIGSVQETLTVTGAAPLVDVQTTQQQFIVSKQLFDAIPTPFRDFRSRLSIVPGATTFKNGFSQGASHEMKIHGSLSTDARLLLDGMSVPGYMVGFGEFGGANFFIEGAQEEVAFDTDGQTAESASSGIRMNAIPKSGGNAFSGQAVIAGANSSFAKRPAPETPVTINGLQVGLIGQSDRLKYTYDMDYVLGGPITKDKVWFFAAYKYLEDTTYVANTYFVDGSQAILPNIERAAIGRATYQMSDRNKFRLNLLENEGKGLYNQVGAGRAPEASRQAIYHTQNMQLKWTSPVTNRLLLEAGFAKSFYSDTGIRQPGTENLLPRLELSTNASSVSYSGAPSRYEGHHTNPMATASYATGSHNFKAGLNWEFGNYYQRAELYKDIATLRFLSSVADSVTVSNTPYQALGEMRADVGVFAQDRWTVRRLTLNLGIRFDYFDAGIPAQTSPAGTWVPERSVQEVPNVPHWKDWEPRLGGAFDLFGNGKTALKGSVGRYVIFAPGAYTTPFNPIAAQSENRIWTDLDKNGTVVDAAGNIQFAEIGPRVNARFGLPGSASRLDPNFKRPDNWEWNGGLQHELLPGVSLTASYFGRYYRNFAITRNVLVDNDKDYIPFNVTAPLDSRLPNGGGEVITRYDLNPLKSGQVDNVVMNTTSNFRRYTGFEFAANARLPKGGVIYGAITSEKTKYNNCDVVNPNDRRFCASETPFQTLFKIAGSYPLPYGFEISGNMQGRPGLRLGALWTINNTIAGRTLTVVHPAIELIPSDTVFYDYFKQLDLRVTKTMDVSRLKIRGYVDIFNIFNQLTVFGGPRGAQVTGANETFGPSWLLPQRSQQPLSLRVGAQLNF